LGAGDGGGHGTSEITDNHRYWSFLFTPEPQAFSVIIRL
jgi:hypothetical protein